MKSRIINFLFLTIFLVLLSCFLVLICNFWIQKSTATDIYTNWEKIPTNDVGLVLGTSPKTHNGYNNLYFTYRMEAAAHLYHAGKIKHILVSGDNHRKSYNEPKEMQAALMRLGVPSHKITLDYAGFRTLDSVVRAHLVFQQSQFTIISQDFHNQRAVFLAKKYGIDAIAYNAKNVRPNYSRTTRYREYLAKTKAVLDIYLLRKKPKFLGKKEEIKL